MSSQDIPPCGQLVDEDLRFFNINVSPLILGASRCPVLMKGKMDRNAQLSFDKALALDLPHHSLRFAGRSSADLPIDQGASIFRDAAD